MLEGALIGGLIGLIAALFLLYWAKSATGEAHLKTMPANAVAFDVARPPGEILATLESATPAGAKAVNRDVESGTVLMAQTPSFNNFGNFFPVRVTAAAGGSRVEVGAAARASGNAKVTAKARDAFVVELKKVLGVPALT